MTIYNNVLNNPEYLETVKKIEKIKFITDGKWDWEHGLGHYKRVAYFVEKILKQLNADNHLIDLGMTAALLHDIGLINGKKQNHAIESSKIFANYLDKSMINNQEQKIIKQAILDHSNGNDIKSLIGLALVLADKLDVTYHRTKNSSIQDNINKEFGKINNVDINITNENLIVNYYTNEDFTNAVHILNKYGIDVVTHIMIGLFNVLSTENSENKLSYDHTLTDTDIDNIQNNCSQDVKMTVDFLNQYNIQGLKIHSCYVVKNTKLEKLYQSGKYIPISLKQYLAECAYVITHINPNIIIHRVSGDAPKDLLVAPSWNLHKKWIINGLDKYLKENNLYQGMFYKEK